MASRLTLIAIVAVVGVSLLVVLQPAISQVVGYTTIQDEGVNLGQRNTLNMKGATVTCADNVATLTTDCEFAPIKTILTRHFGTDTLSFNELTGNACSPVSTEKGTACGPNNNIGAAAVQFRMPVSGAVRGWCLDVAVNTIDGPSAGNIDKGVNNLFSEHMLLTIPGDTTGFFCHIEVPLNEVPFNAGDSILWAFTGGQSLSKGTQSIGIRSVSILID